MIIREKVEVIGMKKLEKVDALIDTGASTSYLRKDLADEIGAFVLPNKTLTKVGDGRLIEGFEGSAGIVIRNCPLRLLSINIIKECTEKLVLGADFLQEHKANVDLENDKLIIKCPLKEEMLV